MPVELLDGVIVSVEPLLMVTALVLVESNDSVLMVKFCPSVVVKFAAVGLLVTKCTSVVAPGAALVSVLLVASVRQLLAAVPTVRVFQLPSIAPDQ